MSTNFPTSLDNNASLGGPFINVAPPVDPFRNISADYRNNLNDAVFAVEQRVGYIGDPSSSTIDWATLTVGPNPNQGLRFAGSHAIWPGAIGEGGLFIDSANNHVSFHKGGDPVATFVDLTAGGSPTWDSIYALDQHLLVNAASLDFQGAHASNPVFRLGGTGTGNVLEGWAGIIGAGSAIWSLFPTGKVSVTPINPTATFTAHDLSLTSGGADGAVSALTGYSAALTGNTGDTNSLIMVGYRASYTDPGSGSTASAGFWAEAGLTVGAYLEAPIHIEVASTTMSSIFDLSTSNVGPAKPLMRLRDTSAGSIDRLFVDQTGVVQINSVYDVAGGPAVKITNTWSINANGMILELRDQSQERARFYNDGQLSLTGIATMSTRPLLRFDQTDDDEAFIYFGGTEAADTTKNISSFQGDGANVVGPHDPGAGTGYLFYRMVRHRVNGIVCWVPAFIVSP